VRILFSCTIAFISVQQQKRFCDSCLENNVLRLAIRLNYVVQIMYKVEQFCKMLVPCFCTCFLTYWGDLAPADKNHLSWLSYVAVLIDRLKSTNWLFNLMFSTILMQRKQLKEWAAPFKFSREEISHLLLPSPHSVVTYICIKTDVSIT
jgi:hypothetical protein